MELSPKDWWHILKHSFKRFFRDNPFRQSAAIAYYTIFALPGIAILQHTVSKYLAGYSYYIILGINIGVSFGLVVLIFASIYKLLPDAAIRWSDVWTGAMVTTVFFVAGKLLIGYYLSNSNLNDVYGAAGSLVAMLARVYYSVLIFLFGAHFTYVYNQHKGRTIRPDKNAVAIKIQEIERGHEPITKI